MRGFYLSLLSAGKSSDSRERGLLRHYPGSRSPFDAITAKDALTANVPLPVMHLLWNPVPILSESVLVISNVSTAVAHGPVSADVNYLEEF